MFRRQGNLRFIQGRRHGFLVLLLLLLWRQESNEVTLSVRHSVSPPPSSPPGSSGVSFSFSRTDRSTHFSGHALHSGKKKEEDCNLHSFLLHGRSFTFVRTPPAFEAHTYHQVSISLSLGTLAVLFFWGGGEEGRKKHPICHLSLLMSYPSPSTPT